MGLSEVQPNSRTHTHTRSSRENSRKPRGDQCGQCLSDRYNEELLSMCEQRLLEVYAGDVNEGSGGDVYEGHAYKNFHIYIIQTSGLICVCLMGHAGLFLVFGNHERCR